jgi:hypothetical protein
MFFLDAQALANLQCKKVGGGIGCGSARKFYLERECERAAKEKHTSVGLASKREAREKREANKRKRETEAAEADQHRSQQQADPGTVTAPANPWSGAELTRLRKQVASMFSSKMTWDYVRPCESKSGTIRLDGIQQAAYAALIGRPDDPGLRTLVKKGAWYTSSMSVTEFFAGLRLRGKGGRYGTNEQLGIDPLDNLVVKYSPSNETLSIKARISHVATHVDQETRDECRATRDAFLHAWVR